MESNSTTKHRRFRWSLVFGGGAALLLVALVLFLAVTGTWRLFLQNSSLSDIKATESRPVDSVTLRFFDVDGEPFKGRSILPNEVAAASKEGVCHPEKKLGDPSPEGSGECSFKMALDVRHHPVAASLAVRDGNVLREWWEKNPDVKRFMATKLAQGILSEILKLGMLRGEDFPGLGLAEGFARDLFWSAASSDARLHYDPLHGNGGVSFSFKAGGARTVRRALVALVELTSQHGYAVKGLDSPAWELLLGTKQLIVTEAKGRIYVGIELAALINAIENDQPVREESFQGSAIAVLRAEAFFGSKMLQALTGKDAWHSFVEFDLTAKSSRVASINVEDSALLQSLYPAVEPGLAQVVPNDVMAAAIVSFPLIENLKTEQWNTSAGPVRWKRSATKAGGIALVWDLATEGDAWSLSQVALLIAEGENASSSADVRRFFRDSTRLEYCPAAKVWMAASHLQLLEKLSRTCQKELGSLASLSPRAREGSQAQLYFNAEVLLRESFGRGVKDAEKKARYEENRATQAGESTDEQKRRALERLQTAIATEVKSAPKQILVGKLEKRGWLVLRSLAGGNP